MVGALESGHLSFPLIQARHLQEEKPMLSWQRFAALVLAFTLVAPGLTLAQRRRAPTPAKTNAAPKDVPRLEALRRQLLQPDPRSGRHAQRFDQHGSHELLGGRPIKLS